MAPDFSVIIPTFRRPLQLREAIDSVLAQKGVTVEVVVVDDSAEGSARPAVEAVNDSRVTYRKMAQPTGGIPARVRNHGWPGTTGVLVHFLDDDDLLPDGHYLRVKQAFAAHPEVGVVFGVVKPFATVETPLDHELRYFADAARRARSCNRFGPRLAFGARMLFEPTMIVCSNCVVRRECVAALGGFDPDVAMVEDVEFYSRVMRRFGAHFLDQVTLHYRIGPSLMHSRTDDSQIAAAYKLMHRKYRATYGRADFLALKIFARSVLRLA